MEVFLRRLAIIFQWDNPTSTLKLRFQANFYRSDWTSKISIMPKQSQKQWPSSNGDTAILDPTILLVHILPAYGPFVSFVSLSLKFLGASAA
jgi:hypothetical protein